MVAKARPSRVDQKWQFRVDIEGLTVGHFNSVTGMESEVANTDYHQGGKVDPACQTPGKRTHTELVLSAGACENNELWIWYKQVSNGQIDINALRKTVEVHSLARDGETILRTRTYERAWVRKFSEDGYDASSSDNLLEQVTLVYEKVERDR
jgi:phage tail-like protein